MQYRGVLAATAAAVICFASPLSAAEPTSNTFERPVSLESLDDLRGGDSRSGVNGEVGNNSVEGVVSGDNRINTRSFAGASGITTVIQNTGANVLIQNGMVVNVQFADPTP